jgi:hypothetical protein
MDGSRVVAVHVHVYASALIVINFPAMIMKLLNLLLYHILAPFWNKTAAIPLF